MIGIIGETHTVLRFLLKTLDDVILPMLCATLQCCLSVYLLRTLSREIHLLSIQFSDLLILLCNFQKLASLGTSCVFTATV